MPSQITSYRVFIASPGGLQEERRAFRDTLAAYSESEAIPRRVIFLPIGWETAAGGVGRPQSIINEEVQSSDYLVLVLWDRWGSPPGGADKSYTSGTEEEFDVALECFELAEKPMRRIVVFFKAVDPKQLSDPGPQLQKVLDFKQQLEESKKFLFYTFDTLDSFKEFLRRDLARWLRDSELGKIKKVAPSVEPVPLPAMAPSEKSGVLATAATSSKETLKKADQLAAQGKRTEAEAIFARAVVGEADPWAFTAYGNFLFDEARYDQALTMSDRAGAIAEQLGLEKAKVGALQLRGQILEGRGDLAAAESAFSSGLSIAEKVGDESGMAVLRNDLGRIHFTLGKLDSAQVLFQLAHDSFVKIGDDDCVGTAKGSLAGIYRVRGDYAKAEKYYRDTIDLGKKVGNEQMQATGLGNLAELLREKGEYTEAEKLLHQSIAIEKKLNHVVGMAMGYVSLGVLHRDQKNSEEAEKALKQALELWQSIGNPEGIALAYSHLAHVNEDRGDTAEAEKLHRASLHFEEELGHLSGIATDCANLGRLAASRGDATEARQYLERSRDIYRQMGLPAKAEAAERILRKIEPD